MKALLFIISLLFGTSAYCQQVCRDTSKRNVLHISGDTSLLIEKVLTSNNKNRILAGYLYREGLAYENGLSCIIKTDNKNQIIWSKALSVQNLKLQLSDAIVLNNGYICVPAATVTFGSISRWVLTFDENGILLYSREFRYNNIPNKVIDAFKIAATPDGKLIILAVFESNNLIPIGTGVQNWFSITKCSTNGIIDWSAAYQSNERYYPVGILVKQNSIYLNFLISRATLDINNTYGHQILKLNGFDGALIISKTLFYPGPQPNTGLGIPSIPLFESSSGSTINIFTYRFFGYDSVATIMQIDTLLNVLSSKFIKLKTNTTGYRFNFAAIDTDNKMFISGVNSVDNSKVLTILIDSSFIIKEQKYISFASNPSLYYWSFFGAYPVVDNTLLLYNRSFINGKFQVEIAEYPISSLPVSCSGIESDLAEVKSFTFNEGSILFNFQKYNVTEIRVANFSMSDFSIQTAQTCLTINERILSAGNDLKICKGDTSIIRATGKFFKYTWHTNYNQEQLDNSTIKIWPLKDTSYTVSATTGSGCVLYDTVFITVKQPLPVNLGADTSFCKGDSIILNVPNTFQSYNWSTGEKDTFLKIKEPGSYSISALNQNGCISKDTIIIHALKDTPQVSISINPVLCASNRNLIDAGAGYLSYLWQDNSTNRLLPVTQRGAYQVKVQNTEGCYGKSNVALVNSFKQPFYQFLINDTGICNYESILLYPSIDSFSAYNWNTGQTTRSITVNSPGEYVLLATDRDGCFSTDTVNVYLKQCPARIFFPNAFTPDGNRLNDVFKPIITGKLITFQLKIYNRWGQEVFETREEQKGWNGIFNNVPQPVGNYTYRCTYQFAGEKEKSYKGSILLIR
jgi:gliding motility-associated-like protein